MPRNSYIEGFNSDMKWRREEALRTEKSLREDSTITDGVVRWHSNDRVPPEDIVEFAAYLGLPVDVVKSTAARDVDQTAFIAAYRVRMAQRTPEEIAEQRSEARAAMGPGARMVNVLTGERYTT